MKIVRNIMRMVYINITMLKHICMPWRPVGVRLRIACEELGPIFVKFGQLLSTRTDMLPDEVIQELSKLQDQVPPFCGAQACKIVETSLGEPIKPINQLFAFFNTTPLASASIAQVHAATTLDGQDVVVKILRPNIKKQIARDIDLLLTLATLAQKFSPTLRQFKPYALVLEIKKSIFDELDLMREAANASQLRRNFADSNLLYVPQIHWTLCKNDVLTMERIYGTPISKINELKARNVDLKLLAARGVEIFFTQAFRDCFFHADLHPGNIWVADDKPDDPQYLALDFGIIGTLGSADRHYLAENFLAFFKRDYKRVAELHVEYGWVPKGTRVDEFEAAIRSVCEPILTRPLKDISFGAILLRLLQTAKRFDIQIQPQLLLFQKTLLYVEGLGRQLDPDLDLWNTALPVLERWTTQRKGPDSLLHKLKTQGPFWLEKLPDLPALIYKALQNIQHPPGSNLVATNQATAAIRPSVWYYFVLGAVSATLLTLIALRFIYV